VLRRSEARDRAGVIELLASAEVNTYLGGPQPRERLERELPDTPEQRPGLFVVELDGAMIGTVELNRRHGEHANDVHPDTAELGYLFLPHVWGRGYAAEACAAVLGWYADARPGEPVVLRTQTANTRSIRLAAKLGFTEVKLYRAWGAEQWLGIRFPAVPARRSGD
jgi:RimJ/RimL family protein N-acetyltransferase